MSIAYYIDVHIPNAVTVQLRMKGVDVLTAQEDGTRELPDPELLDRATELGRIVFTMDHDLLSEATLRDRVGGSFLGVIYAHQVRMAIGECVSDLERLAKATESVECGNRVEYLRLR